MFCRSLRVLQEELERAEEREGELKGKLSSLKEQHAAQMKSAREEHERALEKAQDLAVRLPCSPLNMASLCPDT